MPNENFDTGELQTYRLPFYGPNLREVAGQGQRETNLRDVARDILAFYADLGAPFATKKDPKAWHDVLDELDKLKASPSTGPELEHPQ